MSSLFISHSSRDQNIATRLVDRLRSVGFASLFVDFDPECGIITGRDWEREIYIQLRKADGVIFLGSPASNQSPWCFAELALARSIRRPIFPVLIGNIEPHALLDRVQGVRWNPRGVESVHHWLDK
jgi:TIR domain